MWIDILILALKAWVGMDMLGGRLFQRVQIYLLHLL
jgi:hypothetical protein